MNQIEYRIHVACVTHTKGAFPQIQLTHAGKARDETHAHFLQKMGYEAGTGDILWFCMGKFGEIEIKHKAAQSSDQKTRECALLSNGGHYAIIHSVAEIHAYWLSLGFDAMHHAIKEPDLRTQAEKFAAAQNFFSPRS